MRERGSPRPIFRTQPPTPPAGRLHGKGMRERRWKSTPLFVSECKPVKDVARHTAPRERIARIAYLSLGSRSPANRNETPPYDCLFRIFSHDTRTLCIFALCSVKQRVRGSYQSRRIRGRNLS